MSCSLDLRSESPRSPSSGAGRLVRLPDGTAHLIGTAPVTIGREPSSDIPVHSEDASRSHAYLLRTPQGFLLVDSSLHGTYVNGERVQAQRILSDGDVLQIAGHSFRFDLRALESEPAARSQSSAGPPETSVHASPGPRDSRATGKVGLVLALAERPSRGRLATWIRRYGPSELIGIGGALGGSWLLGKATGSAIAAAYGAALGEALGFYGSLIAREMIQEAYFAGARRAPYGVAQMVSTWRGLFLEFGPAELLDSGLIRPLAMGLGRQLLGWGPGIVAGKLVADLVFYLPVVWIYERRRRAGAVG